MMYDHTKSVLELPINVVTTVLWIILVLGFIPVALVWWLAELSAEKLRALKRRLFPW